MKQVRAFEQYVTNHPEYLAEALTARSIQPPVEPDYHLFMTDDGVHGIIERQTKTLFPFA